MMNAIVPFYFWVWYNHNSDSYVVVGAIVPFYFWVWYNLVEQTERLLEL